MSKLLFCNLRAILGSREIVRSRVLLVAYVPMKNVHGRRLPWMMARVSVPVAAAGSYCFFFLFFFLVVAVTWLTPCLVPR